MLVGNPLLSWLTLRSWMSLVRREVYAVDGRRDIYMAV